MNFYKIIAVFNGLLGTLSLVSGLYLILRGFSLSIILFAFVAALFAYSSVVLVLNPKSVKVKAAIYGSLGSCMVIMGLLHWFWGDQTAIPDILLVLVGLFECAYGGFIFINSRKPRCEAC